AVEPGLRRYVPRSPRQVLERGPVGADVDVTRPLLPGLHRGARAQRREPPAPRPPAGPRRRPLALQQPARLTRALTPGIGAVMLGGPRRHLSSAAVSRARSAS